MCGIVGFITPRDLVTSAVITQMARTLAHRGPDDAGHWLDRNIGIALGHQRLSIVDLSPNGHQPMASACGRYVITFNGEIYNFLDLRKLLDGEFHNVSWRGRSDTEVILAATAHWGVERALRSFVGMFAFALWDRKESVLHLVRDRLGEKPLYYGVIDGSFVFASELKALAAFPAANLEVDRESLAALLRFGYVPAPCSIYRGICKLAAGTVLSVAVPKPGSFRSGSANRYWTINYEGLTERRQAYAQRSDPELTNELHSLIKEAVAKQMVADVPLGAFLSGGIDSSTIVALMQAQSSQPVRTFTIGFHEETYNEARHANAVARHLGTQHTELYVTPCEAAEVIPRLPEVYDEPFADSSQIPTYLLSHLTRQHVTVSLSGDGGDELFGGYGRYQFAHKLWACIDLLPTWSRSFLAKCLTAFTPSSWDRALRLTLPAKFHTSVTGHRFHRLAALLEARGFPEMYIRLISQWQPADRVLADATIEKWPPVQDVLPVNQSLLNKMREFDIGQYLPDDILVKVDRAAMSASLESRVPLLDHRVVEFAWALPESVLVRSGRGKWLLREVLYRYVPRDLVDRPKTGFGIPVGRWLRHELRDWAEDLLDAANMRVQGFLDPRAVQHMWREHLSGAYDREPYLWNVLMFQAWLQAHRTTSSNGSLRLRQCTGPLSPSAAA